MFFDSGRCKGNAKLQTKLPERVSNRITRQSITNAASKGTLPYVEPVLEQHTPADTAKRSRDVSNLIVSYLHALTGENGPDVTTVIRTVIPAVVKQTNSCDCGLFLLHYFSAFLYCKDVHELVKNFRETPIPTQHLWPNVDVDPVAGRIYVLQCLVNIQGCHVSHDSSQLQDAVHGAFNTCLQLPNYVNTCYINVILQLLLRLPIITDAVIRPLAKNQPPDGLIALFLGLFKETKNEIPNKKNVEPILKQIVAIGRAKFGGRRKTQDCHGQEDCHELLCFFLESFLTAFETMGILESVGFRGTEYVKASTACCPTSPLEQHEVFFETLSLPIPDVDVTIQRCIAHYMTRESKDTDFLCQNCSKKGALVHTETRIRLPPEQLIIQLARCTFDSETETAGKNEASVTVTTSLDMATCLEVPRPCMYSLACVVFHQGKTLHSGHYFVAVKLVEGLHEIWYVLNDGHEKERVTDIDAYLRDKKKEVYILVYESNDSTEKQSDTTGPEIEDEIQVISGDNSEAVLDQDVEDGHTKVHEDYWEDHWHGDLTDYILPQEDPAAADKKLYNSKKEYRSKAGSLKDVCWQSIGEYSEELEGKHAAAELCPVGHHWLSKKYDKAGKACVTFVCAWEKCPFVTRLVQSDNMYQLYVVKGRLHVHDVVCTGKVPTAITVYVQKKWKEYRFLAPSAVKNLMTTQHVSDDICIEDRHKFEEAFRDKQVWTKFTRWFWMEKQKQSSLENERKSKDLAGLNLPCEWNDMFASKWASTQGTLGELHTQVTFLDYNAVKERPDFGPNSVYYIAYKFKRVCEYD